MSDFNMQSLERLIRSGGATPDQMERMLAQLRRAGKVKCLDGNDHRSVKEVAPGNFACGVCKMTLFSQGRSTLGA